ncbi:hypothetical protein GCM10027168_31840 [Streptomyces capparidis]
MTLLRPDEDRLTASARELFRRAAHRAPWSARELIGSGRTELTEDAQERAWLLASTGYYAEQAGLVAAAELAAQTEDVALRMGLATAVADEARHSDAFLAYAVARGGRIADCAGDDYLTDLHAMLSSAEYLEKCLLHTVLEGLAADEFLLLRQVFAGDPLADIYRHVRADELLHVAIGLDYLRRSAADPRDREQWAAHGAAWERRCLELAALPAVSQGLGQLLGRPPERVEQWFTRRHRARLRGAGIRLEEGGDTR